MTNNEYGGLTMLVLTRKSHESVVVGGPSDLTSMLKITVLEISAGRVKLGFDATADLPVHRWEVWQRIRADGGLEPQAEEHASWAAR